MPKYINSNLIFENRTEAGKQLAEKLISYRLQNPIVIALPRGGVPVAKPISDLLHAKLDIMISKKIGAPFNPELAIGAVTSGGDYVIAPYYLDIINEMPLEKKWDYIQNQIVYLIKDCQEKEKKYCGSRSGRFETCHYMGHDVIIVDDGIATGMTAMAAIKSIKKQNPKNLIIAAPVISHEAFEDLKEQVNKIEFLKIPESFIAVGVHYLSFEQVGDEEIKNMLDQSL